jgi:hypothetical protein
VKEKKGINSKNYVILGLAILVCIVIVLLATPMSLFAPLTFIDTELHQSSENRVPVRTKTDFGNPKVMASFPYEIGEWEGYDYPTTSYVERLGADLILLRGYLPTTSNEELFMTIVQAKTESSVHDPHYCFRSQGYTIQEDGDENVVISDSIWVKGAKEISLPFRRLTVTKTFENGKTPDQRVVLYCYVKGNQFYSDTVTMIQTETMAVPNDSNAAPVSKLKGFLAQAIPLMFTPGQSSEEWRPLALLLTEGGTGGFIILGFLFLIPLGIILYPVVRWKIAK